MRIGFPSQASFQAAVAEALEVSEDKDLQKRGSYFKSPPLPSPSPPPAVFRGRPEVHRGAEGNLVGVSVVAPKRRRSLPAAACYLYGALIVRIGLWVVYTGIKHKEPHKNSIGNFIKAPIAFVCCRARCRAASWEMFAAVFLRRKA